MTTTMGSLDLGALNNLYDETQYFWFESSAQPWGAGAHVTLYPQSEFTTSTHANYLKGQNILINTDGISIRNGLLPMMTLDNNSLDFNTINTTAGTYTNVASFGSSSTIGVTDGTQSYLYMDYHSVQAIDKEGIAYFDIHDLRDREGYAEIKENFVISSTRKSFNVSFSVNSPNGYSPVISDGTTNYAYTLYGQRFTISNPPSTTTNVTITYKTSSTDAKAYTLGVRLAGSNIGGLSLAEGNGVTASGMCAHAEGYNTTASGNYSHAGGIGTIASSPACVAFGLETIAARSGQMVIGRYNKEDTDGEYFFIIGNGSSASARSNAFAVGWNGQLYGNNNQLDYVIETGSSSPWEWAKYASGRIECWGEKSWSNVDCKTSAGGGYRSADVSQALPSGLFTDIESCQATMKSSGGNGYTMALRTLCTPTAISQMFWNTSNATKSTCIVDYYIIGT